METKQQQQALCVEDHIGLIFLVAKRLNIQLDDEDVQNGRIAIWNAIKCYKPPNKFSSYAVPIIHREIKKGLGKKKKYGAKVDNSDKYTSPEEVIDNRPDYRIYEYLPSYFSLLDKKILDMYLQGMSMKEIGIQFGKTRTWANKKIWDIVQIIKEANEV